MKKILLVILSMITVANGFGQLYSTFSYPSSVDLFGLCEISFLLPKIYSNPYDPDTISVYAVFTSPDNSSYTVNGFYYEDYTFQKHNEGYEVATHHPLSDGWRIRFTPNKVGTWTFVITATDINGNLNLPYLNVSHTFSCTSVSDADGFISKANSRFLKRDIVRNGQRQFHSFFPIGPDIAWYSCKNDTTCPAYSKPYGIYEYKKFIDSLDGNANYMRVFLSQFQYLSLFGPEYTQLNNDGKPIVYFNNTVNQKDSAELDYIITYAKEHGVTIMPCMFNCTNFIYHDSPTSWENNPFNNVLEGPCYFFTDQDAIKITKNLIRYIISRWGYATNIVSWEFWNEVSNMIDYELCDKNIDQDIQIWHEEMVEYVAGIDPFNHCITTSMGNIEGDPILYPNLFYNLDFVQQHEYQNIQNAASNHQLSYILYSRTKDAHQVDYPAHPFFMGEFGFGQGKSSPSYFDKDPHGIDLHNSLWSSTFSTSMGPASFWWWYYLKSNRLFCRYRPILHFCESLPLLSETFTPNQTGHEEYGYKLVFPNNLETYYMINAAEDTIYGWSQDTAFAYQSLRWLTDSVHFNQYGNPVHFDSIVFDTTGYVYTLSIDKRPGPSSNSNCITIPIINQPIGTRYKIIWYNSETGFAYPSGFVTYANVQQNGNGGKVVSFKFPSFIRNIQQQTITNTFGDVVFSLILDNLPIKSSSVKLE